MLLYSFYSVFSVKTSDKMGRIKTAFVKRITNDLLKSRAEQFTDDFEKNKELVSKNTDVSSKKIRNIIAGYVTRKMKETQD